MASDPLPPPPVRRGGPNATWPHRALYGRVVAALHALPSHFSSTLDIEGVRATDIFSFNSALGATIEEQVVTALNRMRIVWDPEGIYQTYSFRRQPQTFPDVRLQSMSPGSAEPVLLGIELKGWFALAKEGEPSFRYVVTPAACADADLLVVVPWLLQDVISGAPTLLNPFVEEARFAAEARNYHWTHLRGSGGPADQVELSTHATPYPSKTNHSSDRAHDAGGNFGRVARANIMGTFVTATMNELVAGIPVRAWHRFLKAFTESADDESIARKLRAIERDATAGQDLSEEERHRLATYLESVASVLRAN
jgi:hypothetical protein